MMDCGLLCAYYFVCVCVCLIKIKKMTVREQLRVYPAAFYSVPVLDVDSLVSTTDPKMMLLAVNLIQQ